MLKLVFLGLISACMSKVILQSRVIQLENGKVLTMKGVSSEELEYVETQLGCSTKCAHACLSFSFGEVAVQCMSHCGCSTLFDSKAESVKSATNLVDGDISVDVFFPKSESGDTEIFIQDGHSGARITVDAECDQKNKEYEVDVTVNSNNNNQQKDELVIAAAGKQKSTGTYDVVAYEQSDGENGYVYVQKEEASKRTADKVVVDNYEYVEVFYEDYKGKNSTAYVEHAKETTANSTTVVVVEATEAKAGPYNYESVGATVITGNDTHVQGKEYKEFEWWVNTQTVGEFAGSWSWLEISGLVAVLVAVALVAYMKYSQVKAKRYTFTEGGSQSESSYIRL